MRYIPDLPENWYWLFFVLMVGSCTMYETHEKETARADRYAACMQYSPDHSPERCKRETE